MNVKIFSLIYVLLVPLVVYQIRYLAFHVDNTALWFYRFLSGGLFLLIFIMIFKRTELSKLFREKRNVWIMLLYAVMAIAGSFALSTGVKLTNATTGNLINSMSLPLTVGMAYIIWREEEEILKNRFVQAGMLMSLTGVCGFSLASEQFAIGSNFTFGVIVLFGGVLIICGSTLLLRSLLRKYDAMTVSGAGMFLASILLLIPTCLQGSINTPLQLPGAIFGFLLFSGVFGAVIFLLGLHVLRISGVRVFKTVSLLVPVMSAVYGIFFLAESFNTGQLFFALVLLTGGYFCIGKKRNRSERKLFSSGRVLLRSGKSN